MVNEFKVNVVWWEIYCSALQAMNLNDKFNFMVKTIDQNTVEDRILLAAQQEFAIQGLKGARMQVIASNAGVNKALLHYYFRSKEQLHQRVIESFLNQMWHGLSQRIPQIQEQLSLQELIRTVVANYLLVLQSEPPNLFCGKLSKVEIISISHFNRGGDCSRKSSSPLWANCKVKLPMDACGIYDPSILSAIFWDWSLPPFYYKDFCRLGVGECPCLCN